MCDFVNIHQHSQYSLLDGKSKIPDMVARAKALGQPALGLTDHGNQFGLVEFYKECKKQGVKPVLGNEFYLVENHDDRTEDGKKQREFHHVTVVAMNNEGLKNLNKLTTRSAQNYFYKPRISIKDLQELNEGLIVTSGCMASIVSDSLLKGDIAKAEKLLRQFKEAFGDRYYIEVQDGGVPGQKKLVADLRDLSRKLDIKRMVSNDSHYVNKEDAFAHSVMLAINTGSKMSEKPTYEGGKRFAFSTDEYYMKGDAELKAEGWTDDELAGTREIAERCNVEIKPGMKLPKYPKLPEGVSSMEYLKQLCREGWDRKRIGYREGFDYGARILKEFKDIEDTGIADYFLIVSDYCRWARGQGYGVGDGRGSAAGSLVSYLTDITTIDPLKYGLYWERFWNAGRAGVGMPDIDSDFSQFNRGKIIEYIKNTFGADRVIPIISFNKMQTKMVLKDTGRVLGVSAEDMNKITSQVPHKVKSLEEALENSTALRDYEKKYKKVFEIAKQLQNTVRNTSTHPSALVVLDAPYTSGDLPLSWDSKTASLITGYDMYTLDWLGYLKIDVLGLKNLDILTIVSDLVKQGSKGASKKEAVAKV